jgi:triosephosphate isomerase
MTNDQRKPVMAGNWKMNINHLESIAYMNKMAFSLIDADYARTEVVIFPPFTDIRSVQTVVDADHLSITYGAQDISAHDSGAYTGEISGAMLKKC